MNAHEHAMAVRAFEVAAAWDALPTRTRGLLIADPVTHEFAASASWLAAENASIRSFPRRLSHPRDRARRHGTGRGFWRGLRARLFKPMSQEEAEAWVRSGW